MTFPCPGCGYGTPDGRDDAPAPFSVAWYREHKAAHIAGAYVDSITLRNLDAEISDAIRDELAARLRRRGYHVGRQGMQARAALAGYWPWERMCEEVAAAVENALSRAAGGHRRWQWPASSRWPRIGVLIGGAA